MKLLLFCISLALATFLQAQTLPPGPQVLTFFSDLDDSEQPYSIYIPKDYDTTKLYPLVVMLHGAGSNHRLALRRVFGKSNLDGENDVEASLYFPQWDDIEMIVVAPYARGTAGYQGFVEKDVMDMLADVKRRFSIDENRMYLTGLSMGGGGTLWIGLSRPDLWAAIAAVCPAPPPGVDALAPNALNMAVQFVHGDEDPAVPVQISRDWVKWLRELDTPIVEYLELPGIDHWSWVQAYASGRIFSWFTQFTRDPYPDRVRHASIDLEHGKAYWVQIDAKEPGTVASIDARIREENIIEVTTKGVSAFGLLLATHPMITDSKPLNVIIDGKEMTFGRAKTNISFHRTLQSGRLVWGPVVVNSYDIHKNATLEGPMSDAFSTRHVYVYGTADNPSAAELQARRDTALKAADWSAYRGEFLGRIKFFPRVIADTEVRESDYQSANLILFGTAETNHVIAKYGDHLPMHLDSSATSDHGLVYVFPGGDHYVVVNSGLPWWHAKDNDQRFLPHAQGSLDGFKDFILFKSDQKIMAEGYFSNNWRLSSDDNQLLNSSGVVSVQW